MKKDKNLITSQSGMTLIEIMIALAISSVVILASISIGNMTTNLQSQNNFSFQADMIRRNMVALILSDTAWQKTIQGNPATMACLQTPPCMPPHTTPKAINVIYDGAGNTPFTVGGTNGFNLDGTACTASCPLTFTVTWLPMCTGGPCAPTQVKVDIQAHYNPPTGPTATGKNQMVFNEANYSATLYR